MYIHHVLRTAFASDQDTHFAAEEVWPGASALGINKSSRTYITLPGTRGLNCKVEQLTEDPVMAPVGRQHHERMRVDLQNEVGL